MGIIPHNKALQYVEIYGRILNIMAITKSAKKAIRQSEKRRELNLMYKNKIKTLIKKAKTLATQNNAKEAVALLPDIYSILDKAAKKGVIKKNNASRRKSRLTKLFSKVTT